MTRASRGLSATAELVVSLVRTRWEPGVEKIEPLKTISADNKDTSFVEHVGLLHAGQCCT